MSTIRAIGDEGFNSLSAALDKLDPDFKKLLVEGAYADIIARPGLSLKYRELITVAVLTSMGNAESALKYHAGGMLNTGWTPEALLETAMHTLAWSGAPVAMAGVRLVLMLLHERGLAVGHDTYRHLRDASSIARLLVSGHAPSQALTQKERQLATLAIVMAQGNQPATVRHLLKDCLQLGWSREELTEVLIQLTGYIGWPIVLPLTRVALDVFDSAKTQSADSVASTATISPDIERCLKELEMSASPFESIAHAKTRHLTDIACLTCLSRSADTETLAAHIQEALALGASRQEIVSAIMQALPHAGALAVQSALHIADPLFPASRPDVAEHEDEESALQSI
ncbi:carboxymuconolactone decarboxylase [Paraburkholderia sp. Ac-20340]|uniref:carboxymuconolactone decarboxylase family protein n=1 Tax=Paraburkholderia sp. Ac-20340 TaxID=2703888 RepID=UPI00197EB70B|nr:carboxymuconolactone decarboxylase family protein [Paraburkholderia sp. Ac-20340]MBN3853462.1 carboxymuconolactone decarboxylase [Paraburkholderia sp. Ac-20340]